MNLRLSPTTRSSSLHIRLMTDNYKRPLCGNFESLQPYHPSRWRGPRQRRWRQGRQPLLHRKRMMEWGEWWQGREERCSRCYVPTGFQADWFPYLKAAAVVCLYQQICHTFTNITGDLQVASHIYYGEYDCIIEHYNTAIHEKRNLTRSHWAGFDLTRAKWSISLTICLPLWDTWSLTFAPFRHVLVKYISIHVTFCFGFTQINWLPWACLRKYPNIFIKFFSLSHIKWRSNSDITVKIC